MTNEFIQATHTKSVRIGNIPLYVYCVTTSMIILSKEFVGLRLVLGMDGHNLIVTLCLSIFACVFFASSIVRPKGATGLRINREIIIIFTIIITNMIYLVFHEFKMGDRFISIKYVIYFAFLLMLIMNRDLHSISTVFNRIVLLMSIMSIAQLFIILFIYSSTGDDIDQYESVRAMGEELGRSDAIYKNPFYLGLIRVGSRVKYGIFSFYRTCGYTTEPKYYSLILLTGLISVLYAREEKLIEPIKLLTILIAILFTHSYTSFAAIIIAYFIIRLSRYRINSMILAVAVLLGPLLVSYVILETSSIILPRLDGFLRKRVISFMSSFGSILDFNVLGYGLLGEGMTSDSTWLPAYCLMIKRYGLVQGFLYLSLIFTLYKLSIDAIRKTDSIYPKAVLALGIATMQTSFVMFLPEFITPIFCYIVAICIMTIYSIPQELDTVPSEETVSVS